MKKILLLTLVIAFTIVSCDNKGMDDDYSLIGTWEAAGNYFSSGMNENRNYKCTFIFHDETEYTHIFYYKPVGTTDWKGGSENRGTYTYDKENITYTGKNYLSNGTETAETKITYYYKFTDKNTLITNGPSLS